MIAPKIKKVKVKLRIVSSGIPEPLYTELTNKINNITTIADCIKQLIENYVNNTKV